MISFETNSFPAKNVRSLSWRGDELVDWVDGCRRFSLDGVEQPAAINYGYRFDSATVCPDGRFAVIYEKLGTKALLLDNGKFVRELNRSYYCAEDYEYPVTLFKDASGRVLLAHCPDEYCRIEIEEADTGRAAFVRHDRKIPDFFHSRLAVSPNGKRLLSAGWIWHPWNSVVAFVLDPASDGAHDLDDGEALSPPSGYEEGSACWLNDHTLVVGGTNEEENLDDEKAPSAQNLSPRGLAIYDLMLKRCTRAFQLQEPPGTMWAIDDRHVLSLYKHPKVIDLESGDVAHSWTDIQSGEQVSSIVAGANAASAPPPMAFDRTRRRFAIANGETITVLDFANRDS